MNRRSLLALTLLPPLLGAAHAGGADGAPGLASPGRPAKLADYDVVHTRVSREGADLVFRMRVGGRAGATRPAPNGKLAGAAVHAYVWPTTLDSSAVGFDRAQGVLALAATAHPDFDDTPLRDENGDGYPANDGNVWHSHWVVLVPDDACGPGALKVRDIPAGAKPKLPASWPKLPLLIDSPGFAPDLRGDAVTVRVPLRALGFLNTFRYDGVAAALRVNANLHSPLLCVADVFKVASGNLGLPGRVR